MPYWSDFSRNPAQTPRPVYGNLKWPCPLDTPTWQSLTLTQSTFSILHSWQASTAEEKSVLGTQPLQFMVSYCKWVPRHPSIFPLGFGPFPHSVFLVVNTNKMWDMIFGKQICKTILKVLDKAWEEKRLNLKCKLALMLCALRFQVNYFHGTRNTTEMLS